MEYSSDWPDAAATEGPNLRLRSERASLLNHDIRAALSDVIGGLRLVDPSALDAEARAQFDRVRSSGEVLARMVEEALSWLDDPVAIKPKAANLNLSRFLHDLELRWTGRARAMNATLSTACAETVPLVISVQRMALDRILGNLLSNALKYSGPEGAQFVIDMDETRGLVMRVLDDGPGFSDAALSRLYQYEGRPSGSEHPGTGLGLRIAKEMADQIGAGLSVCNRKPNGAEVTLRIPYEAWSNEGRYDRRENALPDLSGFRILVAEDNETNQVLTGQMLETMGAEYEIAPDGVEALAKLEQSDFDLALIDIEMPRLNGLEVLKAVRQKPGPQSQMPLIALTAYVLKANRDTIFKAGADGIIAKPIMDLGTFGGALAGYLDQVKETDRDAGPFEATNENQQAERPLDGDRIAELLRIAGPLAAIELLDRLLQDLGRVQEQLCVACPIADHATVRAETHVLISLAGAIGARPLYRIALQLNTATKSQDDEAIMRDGALAATELTIVLSEIRKKREGLIE